MKGNKHYTGSRVLDVDAEIKKGSYNRNMEYMGSDGDDSMSGDFYYGSQHSMQSSRQTMTSSISSDEDDDDDSHHQKKLMIHPGSTVDDLVHYIDNNPLFIGKKASYIISHLTTIVQVEKPSSPLKRKSTTKIKQQKTKKRRKNSSSTDDDDDDLGHLWEIDDSLSNNKVKVEVCVCGSTGGKGKGAHYRRPCCSGDSCIGDGYKVGFVKGYCNIRCRNAPRNK